jgi:hypothetical protein
MHIEREAGCEASAVQGDNRGGVRDNKCPIERRGGLNLSLHLRVLIAALRRRGRGEE